MGQHEITREPDADQLRVFTKKLLADLRALERMLEEGQIESDVRRIGAEQEVFLVDSSWRPAPLALEVLAAIDDPHFTTELGRFNIEFNLEPITLGGDCLSRMEGQVVEFLERASRAMRDLGGEVVLTGILPTLEKSDLHLGNMTPMTRYRELNEAMTRLRGREYDFRIKGRDELLIQHDNVMLEACNTSFQVHFQVSPEEFARRYNLAQAVAAPVLACATNSPLLFGRQLWRETRIALFQQSIDTRVPIPAMRELRPRVSFGRQWVERSVLEIFREDVAHFRVLMSSEIDEDPLEALAAERVPTLPALRLHNGTIYRWNRPCYGISDGKPHLRIENRVLPSGPTPRDEVANAAFWFGLMSGLAGIYEDITRVMDFEVARENFVAAGRLGLGAQFAWPGRDKVPAPELILEELLPLARDGLAAVEVDAGDVARYLDVIEERVRTLKTGSQWLIDSLAAMKGRGGRSERLAALVAATARRRAEGRPVHEWETAGLDEAGDERSHYQRIDQLMTTDLFTVGEDELVDMVAYVMNWKNIRHVPVEDNRHRLVGLVTHRSLLRLVGESLASAAARAVPVREIMTTDVVTVRPETSTLDAIRLMRQHKISCLPVVAEDERLVGIVTERDFMGIAGQLLEKFLERA